MNFIKIIWNGFLNIKRLLKAELIEYYWYNMHDYSQVKECKNNISFPEVLSTEQKKDIVSFFRRYDYKKTIFHEFYTQKTGIYSKYYIPDELFYHHIDMFFSNRKMALLFDNKCYYKRMFPAVKQPINVAYRCNGFWYDKDDHLITNDQLEHLLSDSHFEVFLKLASDSMGGHGITFFSDCAKSAEEILKHIKKDNRDIVIQKGIMQHPVLKQLNESSVNTIRIISLLRQNEVKIYSSILRMGLKGAKVDNASSGGITIGILPDGHLKSVAYSANGDRYENEHPSSHTRFSDVVIPNYDKVQGLVKKSHPQIPHFRLASWDIAIDESGDPVLIEVNLSFGELDFHQLNNGPLFGEDTKDILDEAYRLK